MLIRFLITLLCFNFIGSLHAKPEVRCRLSGQAICLGDTLRLDIYSSELIKSHEITLGNKKFPLFLKRSFKNGVVQYTSFLAVSRKQLSGTYRLNIVLDFENNLGFKEHFSVKVDHQKKTSGKVVLSRKKRTLSTKQSLLSNESKEILKAFSSQTNLAYFKKKQFIRPLKGNITSAFAAMRSYSSGFNRSHAGVDIGGKIGTLIRATQAGKVILSKDFGYHGKTIMIDHGYSIISIYNHLNERYVEKGDIVRRGDYIGALGQTGVATGPHLHWGMAVNNIRVNPLFWLKNQQLVQ